MMKESDNLSAECLFRLIGHETTAEPGGTQNGVLGVRSSLARMGIDTAGVIVADGSGVSRYNLVSPADLVRVLEWMYDHPLLYAQFESSLPVAGTDGTLASRMKETPAEGNLRAKTGTLTGASALSGYVRTRDGELLCFSILMQFYPTTAAPYRAVQDSIGSFLASLTRGGF